MSSSAPSPISKIRTMLSGTSKPSSDRRARPLSMASTVTVVPPSPIPPTLAQPSTLAMLQYQQDLMADFWSGSAAGRPPVPPSVSSHSLAPSSNSHSNSSSSHDRATKTKWSAAIMSSKNSREPEVGREPKTAAKFLFIFGFVFPLLWLGGALFLFFPPKPRIDMASLPVHATQERDRRIAMYRAAEAKWAKRCLWAWVAVLAIASVLAVAVAIAKRGGA